ncbi:MAG TPA: SDR family oxidoreductase [Mycobacteriales bacterium]|jgi:3alpha(or 20beta)-hydroxysteroid dehydrogenase|nr:SDR family oxidoreductase [Mycobacteriales bacterium]
MSGNLYGKVAMVTGGARGMGAAEVRRLHGAGASVVAADILDDDGKALADELGDRVRYLHLDVTSEDEWTAAVEQVEGEFGKLDVLVNNAGILKFNAVADTPLEEFRQVLDVNLIGTFLGMKAAIPAMKRAGGGSIVNISSTEGLAGTVFCGAYTASKFGVRGLTKVAAIEYGADAIRVNSVHPGGIDTPMTRAVMDEEGRKYVGKKVAGLKRMGTADEVAGVVLFLAGDDSSYCTGAEFVVDGGVTASAGF